MSNIERNENNILILGQTNVGKSTLFNRLVKSNVSIIFDQNNTTIDFIKYKKDNITFYDTAGVNNVKDFNNKILNDLVVNTDIILYILDSTVGVLNLDSQIISYLRRNKKKIWLIVNKYELKQKVDIIERSDKIYYISAKENMSINNLYDDILNYFNNKNIENQLKNNIATNIDDNINENNDNNIIIKPLISIIGRCNAGKSTLLNRILGYDRVMVSDIEGMTKDSIIEEKEDHLFMDTAGYQKEHDLLKYSIGCRRHNALLKSDGVILLLDGEKGLTHTDKRLIFEGARYGKFMIIAINKKDIGTDDNLNSFTRANIPYWIPVIYISAKKGSLKELFSLIIKCGANRFKRITTGLLNKFLTESKKQYSFMTKIKYICQTNTNPIKICYFGHKKLSDQHELFLKRLFSTYFDLIGVKILIQFNGK
jgi:GTP-binding protein